MSNVGSHISQVSDTASFNNKISAQKKEKDKILNDVGQKMFDTYLEGNVEISDEITDLLEKAKACDAEIERLEKEKAEMIGNEEKKRAERKTGVNSEKEETSEETK